MKDVSTQFCRFRGAVLTLVSVTLLAACGGGGTAAGGNYRHPSEGLISLSDDGTGFVDQSTDSVQLERTGLEWTADGESITMTFENGNETVAILRDGNLVFDPGIVSCCDDTEAIFESCEDCQLPPDTEEDSAGE